MHPQAAAELISDLSTIEAIDTIVLYGSVAKGCYHPKSDIDVACIVDDIYRSFAPGLDDLPWNIREELERVGDCFRERTGIRAHVVSYYHSEFVHGVILQGAREPEPLLKYGKIVFARNLST